jgi:hypothetical protein
MYLYILLYILKIHTTNTYIHINVLIVWSKNGKGIYKYKYGIMVYIYGKYICNWKIKK